MPNTATDSSWYAMARTALIAVVLCAPAHSSLFGELGDIDSIARRRTRPVHQFSSADPWGGNLDFSNYIRQDGNESVMAEAVGSGAIVRIFIATESAGASAPLRVYLDGALVIDTTMIEFTGGSYGVFRRPLVDECAEGYYCLVPIHYRHSFRVTIETDERIYYQVQTCDVPLTPDLITFDGTLNAADQAALDHAVAVWSALGNDPKTAPTNVMSGNVALAPDASETFFTMQGPGQIGELWLDLSSLSDSELIDTRLIMFIDGVLMFDTPVGAFFGQGLRHVDFQSLLFGTKDGGCYCYLPMPYEGQARLSLQAGDTSVSIDWRVGYTPLPSLGDRGTLRAVWDQRDPAIGSYTALQLHNRQGHFVGQHLYVRAYNPARLFFFEGDEHTHVDGEVTPTIDGTGLEDYFNGGFYFYLGATARPMNGCQVRDSPGSGASVTQAALYRFHLLDAIQYLTSLHMTFEAYDPQDFSSVTFFYDFTPEPWTPDVMLDESFDAGAAGWSYLAFNAWGLTAAIGDTPAGALTIQTTNNLSNFGSWQSPPLAFTHTPGDVYRASYLLASNLIDSRRCPGLRMRATSHGGQQIDQLLVNSIGINITPSFGAKSYQMFFAPFDDGVTTGPRPESVRTAFDVINFSTADAASAIMRLNEISVERIPADAIGAPSGVRSFGIDPSVGWDFTNAAPTFAAPDSGLDAQGPWMRATNNTNCYGSAGLYNITFFPTTRNTMIELVFDVSCDEPDPRLVPGTRLRLNSRTSEMVRLMELSSASAGDAMPTPTPRSYSIFVRAPSLLLDREYSLFLDMINFDPNDSASATLRLEGLKVQNYNLGYWLD